MLFFRGVNGRDAFKSSLSVLLIAVAMLASVPAGAAAPSSPADPVVPVPAADAPQPAGVPIDPRVLPFLDPPDFYRAVGRPDLARRYEDRRTGKTILRVGGGILLAGGILIGLIDDAAATTQNSVYTAGCVAGSSTDCQASSSASGVPWAVALIGLGMLIAPACYSTDPLSPAEKAALLGTISAPPPSRPSLSLSVAPAPAPGGGTLTIGGRF